MNKTDEVLKYLWGLALWMGIPLLIVLLIALFKDIFITEKFDFLKDYGKLLSGFFILIASGIASASVMKSIEENKALKKYEISLQNKAKLTFITHVLNDILKSYEIVKDDFSARANIKDIVQTWSTLYQDKYLIFLSDEKIYGRYQDIDKTIYELESDLNYVGRSPEALKVYLHTRKKKVQVHIQAILEYLEQEIRAIQIS